MNQTLQISGREKLFLTALFLFAFFLRLIYLLQVKSNPFFYNLSLDPLFHDLWAKSIASGDLIGQGVFFRAPFYPYFLGIIYKIFGHDLFLARLIQHLIGSFSVILIYLLARKLFDRRVAVIAGLLAATYWILIYFEGELLLDCLLVFLGTFLLLQLYRAADRPTFWNWFLAGIVLGLFAITRPNILAFVPFILLWLLIYFRKDKSRLVCLKYWLYVGIGSALIIFPITLRNYIVGKDLVLVASQGGINFFIGNNPYSDGTSAVVPGLGDDWDYADAVVLAEQELGKRLKPSEASNYFYKRGWDFILNEPGKSIPLLWKKFYLFWNKFEVSNNQNTYFFFRYSRLLKILPTGFWLVGPLAILGMIYSLRRFRKYSLLFFYVFSYMLTVVFFFVADRFRLPVLPPLIIFASLALIAFWDRFRAQAYQKMILPVSVLIIAFWFCNSNFYNLSSRNFAQSYFSLGNIYLKQNQPEKATAYYDSALVLNPNLPRAHLNLGIIQLRQGNLDSAGAEFARALLLNPYEEKAYNNLATIYRLKKEYIKAVQFAKAAVQLRPNYGTAYSNLSLAYLALNLSDSAKQVLQQGLQILSNDRQLHYYLGEIYFRQQNLDLAEREFQATLTVSSQLDIQTYDLSGFGQTQAQTWARLKAQAAYYLGLIWIERKDLPQAKSYFQRALRFKPDLTAAWANLGKISELEGDFAQALDSYTQALAYDPNSAHSYYNRALNYLKLGRIDSARLDLKQCLQIDPHFKSALQLLKSLPRIK
jgi:tetratricopeptide (TPR) repeat protein